MIDAEMVENPVLEEIDETVPMLDEVAGREKLLERGSKNPWSRPRSFNEIDSIVLPGLSGPRLSHTAGYEENESPRFENFLSSYNSGDHLAWQLGDLT